MSSRLCDRDGDGGGCHSTARIFIGYFRKSLESIISLTIRRIEKRKSYDSLRIFPSAHWYIPYAMILEHSVRVDDVSTSDLNNKHCFVFRKYNSI